MQTQHISDAYPNVISITRIRQDIDALTSLLEKYPEVNVLKGQKFIFKVVRMEDSQELMHKRKAAAAYMDTIAKKHPNKKGGMTATDWLIRERDRMRTKAYYDEHHR
jgi:hypothetical protein